MATTTHIHVRDARDRLIDLLGIGQTYPLRDLIVGGNEPLTVAFDTTAKIAIENSQKGVLYQLYDGDTLVERTPEGATEPVPVEAEGNGAQIELETYPIREDITFQIRASKLPWYLLSIDPGFGEALDGGVFPDDVRQTFLADRSISLSDQLIVEVTESNQAWTVRDEHTGLKYGIKRQQARLAVYQLPEQAVYLHEKATVKVGLDVTLSAWIRDVPYLDPGSEHPADARIAYYGVSVEVEIENSQEGVDYQLVYVEETEDGQDPQEVVLSVADVRGDLDNIVLRTQQIFQDRDIRIRATKTFDLSENRATRTVLLDVILPLKVRANPALTVSVDPMPIVDYDQIAAIKIAGTQESTSYQLYIRTIPDRDIIHGAALDTEVIAVPVEGEPDVQVRQPPRAETWVLPTGYVPAGAALPGTGGDLVLTAGARVDDSLIIVRAHKDHHVSEDAQTIPSNVQLAQAAVVLVRPDPAPPLQVRVSIVGDETDGVLQVTNGQPGVFYHFRLDPEGDDLGLPAYFHKQDDDDETINKGVDQLAVEVDFVLAHSLPENLLSPLLETGPLPVDSGLHVRAVKAQTRVATPLAHAARIPAGPQVGPEQAVVDYGAKTRIRIKSSRAREWYQLLLDGHPLADPVKGTGKDRLLDTGELREDTTFALQIELRDEPIVVERVLGLAVQVRPDTALAVSIAQAVVDHGAAAEIRVAASQPGVNYQLVVDGNPVGDPVAGNGDTIELPTGPLSEDTTFAIRAARIDHPEASVDLAQQVTVQVQATPEEG